MDARVEFDDFCRGIHQDIALIHGSMDEAIEASLGQFTAARKESLKQFLSRELERDPSGARLKELFNQSPADFFLPTCEAARSFFALVLARL